MTALILLVFSTLFLTIISYYLFKKNFLSPSFLLCLIFFAGSLLALIGNSFYWKENVSVKTTFYILASLICFAIGEFTFDLIIRKKKPNIVLCTEKTEAISQPIIFDRSNVFTCIMLIAFSLACESVFFITLYKMAFSVGYRPGYLLFAHIRYLYISGIHIPLYASVPDFFAQGIGLIAILLCVRQFFGGKKRFSLLYATMVLPLLFSQYVSSARIYFILDVVIFILSIYYFGVIKFKKIKTAVFLASIVSIISVFLVVFLILGAGTGKVGKTSNYIEIICNYGGSSIIALDKGLKSTNLFVYQEFGTYSFSGLVSLLRKVFRDIPTYSSFMPFVVLNNSSTTNVYTAFMSYYLDFGLYGSLIFSLMTGFCFSAIKYLTLVKERTFKLFFYFYSLFCLITSLFAPVTSRFLSVTYIMQLVTAFIVYFILFHFKKTLSLLKKNKIVGNIIFAFAVQGVSLILSIVMSFFVPKVLGVTEYSYWQLFLLYSTYVGVFHLGYVDGLYLIFGGKKENEIDRRDITAQYLIYGISQLVLAVVTCSIWCPLVAGEGKRLFVVIFTAVYMIFTNVGLFAGYLFQALNKIKTFSLSVLIEKLFFLVAVLVMFGLKVSDSTYFIILYVAVKLLSTLYLLFVAKKVLFAKPKIARQTFDNMWIALKRGFNLMIASLSSLLMMGISRILIDSVWGLTAFGKFSFSISLCSFALAFLHQVSMVFFPALRSVNKDEQVATYNKMTNFLLVILPLSYFAYYVFKFIVSGFLPNYVESIAYFSILLPICVYDGKMQMVSNTFLKVLNKEKKLLMINIISMTAVTISSLIFAYLIPNIFGVVISMVCGVVVRSVIADFYLSRLMKKKILVNFIFETVMVTTFVTTTQLLPDWASFTIMFALYAVLLVVNKKTLLGFGNRIKSLIVKVSSVLE